MKIQLFAILISLAVGLASCTRKNESRIMGIIGADDSIEALDVPGYVVSIVEPIDTKRIAYCNGVKLQDGRFLSALHCFRNRKSGDSIVTSGGIVHEASREEGADLFVGQMIGGVAPSEGAKLYDGTLPLIADLEAHWFDPISGKWRISKGHATRTSDKDLVWHHDLDLNPGASGAGLFYVDDSGERFLVGIHLGFAKNQNIALVVSEGLPTADLIMPSYWKEAEICVGVPGKDDDGNPRIEWICSDGGGAPGGGNPGGDGGDQSGDDGSGRGGGVIIGYPGAGGGSSGGNSGGVSGEPAGGGSGSFGNSGRLADGRTCYACQAYTPEADNKTLFKPECDDDSGFTGLFGQKTPSTDSIQLPNFRLTQTKLTDALRSLAEKMLAEKKWKTPEGMPSKISQLSEETIKRLENWLNQVIKSADDYYALVISSLGSVTKPAEPKFDDTEEGIKRTRQYLEFLKKQIAENPDEFSDRRYSILDASAQFLQVADIQYKTGNPEQAYVALQMSIAAADVAISVTPGLGWAKDVYESWTGYSFTSGKKLSGLERSLAIGGAVSVGVLGAVGSSAKVFAAGTVIFKDAAKLAKSVDELAEIEKATESLLEMSKNAEKAGVPAEILGEGLRSTQRILQEGKHVETVAHDGRSVYKLKDLNPGKPAFVSPGVDKQVQKLINEKGYTNLDLIKEGYAPIGADGRQVNLHHVFGYEPGAVIEMEATAHTQQYKEFHALIKNSFRNNSALRRNFDDFREEWWIERAKDFLE